MIYLCLWTETILLFTNSHVSSTGKAKTHTYARTQSAKVKSKRGKSATSFVRSNSSCNSSVHVHSIHSFIDVLVQRIQCGSLRPSLKMQKTLTLSPCHFRLPFYVQRIASSSSIQYIFVGATQKKATASTRLTQDHPKKSTNTEEGHSEYTASVDILTIHMRALCASLLYLQTYKIPKRPSQCDTCIYSVVHFIRFFIFIFWCTSHDVHRGSVILRGFIQHWHSEI